MANQKEKQIHYFPGHMKKGLIKIEEKLKLIDFVIILLDSRIPIFSINPDLLKLVSNKQKLFLLSKKDMSDQVENKKWLDYFNSKEDTRAILVNLKEQKEINNILKEISYFKKIKDEKYLKKGIKKSYIRKSENLNKYKGKLNFAEHIKHNLTNQSRFFVNYSELSLDIAENKILKTACLYLVKQTQIDNNKKILRRFLVELDDVSVSTNLEKDLQDVNINRLNSYYERPLLYAEFFLRQQVFFPKKGRSKLPALLFPLEKMFEDYIESILKSANISYNSQYSSHYLLKNNLFQTKMDFVIFKDNKAIILDAKWKELNSTSAKFDVAQADLYQLFAYSELIKNNKAEVEEVEIMLLYPESNNFKEVTKWEYFNNTPVSIVPINVVEKENNPLFNKALAKILLN